MAKAFFPPVKPQDELVTKMVELAGIARKDGMMALEGQDVPDKFFSKGLQMLVDGADEAKLTTQLNQEIKAMKARHESNQNVVKAWIDIAPSYGYDWYTGRTSFDARKYGRSKGYWPSHGCCSFDNLYGAFIANVLFLPMITSLEGYTAYEVTYREMVVMGLRNIARGESPKKYSGPNGS